MDSRSSMSSKSCPSAPVLHQRSPRGTLRHLLCPEDEKFVSLTHVLNSHIWEAIRLVWPDSQWADDSNYRGIESRL